MQYVFQLVKELFTRLKNNDIVHNIIVLPNFRFLFSTVSSGKVSCYTTNFHKLLNVNLMKKNYSTVGM